MDPIRNPVLHVEGYNLDKTEVFIWDRVTASAPECYCKSGPCQQLPSQTYRVLVAQENRIAAIMGKENPRDYVVKPSTNQSDRFLIGYRSMDPVNLHHLGDWTLTTLLDPANAIHAAQFRPKYTGLFELLVGKALPGFRADYFMSAAVHNDATALPRAANWEGAAYLPDISRIERHA